MGKLVQFEKRARTGEPKTRVEGQGEIVIFTGVRYERGTTPSLPGKPPASTGSKRKRV